MAISLRNRCPLATWAQLIDASSEINMMSGVTNQRLNKADKLQACVSDHVYVDSAIASNEGQIIYHSHCFMGPWQRIGTKSGHLVYSAAEERVALAAKVAAAATLAGAVGTGPIALATAALAARTAEWDAVKFDITKDYSDVYPDWNYETGVKHA